MSSQADFERLMAYADGELTPEEAAEVERRLRDDPEATETLRELQAHAGRLRAAYGPLSAELPESVTRLFPATSRESPSTGTGNRRHWWTTVAAAVLAAFLVGLPGAYYVSGKLADELRQELVAEAEADRSYLEAAVGEALENELSGTALPWKNPASGHEGQVMPVRSFRSAEGKWCREYVAQGEIGLYWEERRAIACREGPQDWQTRIEMPQRSNS